MHFRLIDLIYPTLKRTFFFSNKNFPGVPSNWKAWPSSVPELQQLGSLKKTSRRWCGISHSIPWDEKGIFTWHENPTKSTIHVGKYISHMDGMVWVFFSKNNYWTCDFLRDFFAVTRSDGEGMKPWWWDPSTSWLQRWIYVGLRFFLVGATKGQDIKTSKVAAGYDKMEFV